VPGTTTSSRGLFVAVTVAMVVVVFALGSRPHPTRVERPEVEAEPTRAAGRPAGTTTTTEASAPTIGPGVHDVGPFGLRPGVYLATGDACSWERRGPTGDVLAADTVSGQVLVNVRATDATFTSSPECGTWRPFDDARPASTLPSFGPGTFVVGDQLAPGRWRSDGGDLCYWERLSGLGGGLDELVDSAGVPGPTEVVLAPTDVAFSSFGCGTWRPAG
jgi:hypothetical protein